MSGKFEQLDTALTAIAVKYTGDNEKFIGNEVAPVVKTTGDTFKYPKWDKKSAFKVPDTALSNTGKYPQIEFSKKLVSGALEDRGLELIIARKDIELEAAASNTTFVETLTEKTVRAMMRRKEIQIAKIAQTAANYGSNTKNYNNTNSWASANTNPIEEINDAMSKALVSFNRLFVASDAFQILRKNPNVVKYFASSNEKIFITEDMIAGLLGLEKVVVGNGRYDVSQNTNTTDIKSAWTATAGLFLFDTPASSTTAQTFMFDGYWMPNGNIRDVFRDSDNGLGRLGSEIVRVAETSNAFVTSEDYGFLFQNVMAA